MQTTSIRALGHRLRGRAKVSVRMTGLPRRSSPVVVRPTPSSYVYHAFEDDPSTRTTLRVDSRLPLEVIRIVQSEEGWHRRGFTPFSSISGTVARWQGGRACVRGWGAGDESFGPSTRAARLWTHLDVFRCILRPMRKVGGFCFMSSPMD